MSGDVLPKAEMDMTDSNTESAPKTVGKTKGKKLPWPKIILAIVIIGALFALSRILPVAEYMQKALDWVDGLGFWGPIAFIGIYTAAVVLFIPGSILTLGAGAAFGIFQGVIYVSIASTFGATLAFLVGRHLARNWVEKKIEGNKSFAAIDGAVAKQGWKIVGLTRLSPVFPFTLLNYAYGITKVKMGHYVLASWIGMLPGTVLYVYIGSLGKTAAESDTKSPAQLVMYAVGLLATIIVTVYITKISKKSLNQNLETE